MLRSALLVVPLAAAGLLVAPAVSAASHTGPPASLTCRSAGIDPAATLHHRTKTFVRAPPHRVWRLLTHVEGWQSWQSAVTGMVRLEPGPLRPGSRFRWTTPAPETPTTPATTLVITSTVQQVRPGQCIRWSGPAIGEGVRIDEGIHVWTFEKVRGGVIVRTEESWTGEQAEADPANIHLLAPGLDAWLADLKTAAESR